MGGSGALLTLTAGGWLETLLSRVATRAILSTMTL